MPGVVCPPSSPLETPPSEMDSFLTRISRCICESFPSKYFVIPKINEVLFLKSISISSISSSSSSSSIVVVVVFHSKSYFDF